MRGRRERERSYFGSSIAPFAWGIVVPPGIGERNAELARGCTPWESFRYFSQQWLSHASAASIHKWPLLLGSLALPLQCANTAKFAPFELQVTMGDLGGQRSPTVSPLNLRDITYPQRLDRHLFGGSISTSSTTPQAPLYFPLSGVCNVTLYRPHREGDLRTTTGALRMADSNNRRGHTPAGRKQERQVSWPQQRREPRLR